MEKCGKKVYYLDYMVEKEKISNDLLYAVSELKTVESFDVFKFYYCLNKLIENIIDLKVFELIKSLPPVKPVYMFGLVYYLLKDNCDYNKLKLEFDYLFDFIDYNVDVFMIVNYLRTK